MGFGKDGKGVIMRESRQQAIGTLAAQTALIIGTNLPTLERYRMIKAELIASITQVATGELGSVYIGLADGDYTVAEIEAAIEASGPLGPNDQIAEELSERFVMILGHTPSNAGNTPLAFVNETGGGVMKETIRWTFARTKSWNWFVYNFGEAPTTGSTVQIRVKSFGVWVT